MKKYFLAIVLFLVLGLFSSVLNARVAENAPKLDLKPLEARAEKGDAEAQAALGIFFIAGREVEKDVKKGFAWLEKAAKQNDPRGLYYFSLCFLDGIGTEKNEAWGLELLQKAIAAGYIPAKTFLGKSLLKAQYNQKKDVSRALKILTEAAREEDAEAQYVLGVLYSGVEKEVKANRLRQMKWLTLSAMHGFVPAQRTLGVEYWNAGDAFWSREWLEAAANEGDAEAEYLLGVHELKGLDGESNPDSAIMYFQKAAEKGFAEAQYLLGITNLELKQELAAAVWLEKAAFQNHHEAEKTLKKHSFPPEVCVQMGLACQFGQDGLYCLVEARRWFGQSLAQPTALAAMAEMELLGIGGPKDEKKAEELLEKGVKEGNPRCTELLAWRTFNGSVNDSNPEILHELLNSDAPNLLTLKALSLYFGLGVERDQQGAEKLFHQASKTDAFAQEWLAFTTIFPVPEGVTAQKDVFEHIQRAAKESKNAHALCLLGLAAQLGWQCERNDAQAVKYFTQAAELGCAPAEFQLFFAYQFGLGTEPEPKKAEIWLQRSMGKGFLPAAALWNMKHSSLL